MNLVVNRFNLVLCINSSIFHFKTTALRTNADDITEEELRVLRHETESKMRQLAAEGDRPAPVREFLQEDEQ